MNPLALAHDARRVRAPAPPDRLNLVLLGCGNVGGALLRMLVGRRDVDVSAIARRSTSRADVLARLRACANPVLVDCTAADEMESLYALALRAGAHVVTANKKPFVSPLPARDALFAAARAAGRQLRYETTVGAGLPVIGPLKDLVRTGDEVRRIEGSFSGTLGYLCGELRRGVPLSRAVASAKELGYTEPHPREDLSGVDVARKALILAREAGVAAELDDVELFPFVPERFLNEDDPAAFIASLAELDLETADRVAQMARDGRELRYLATIDVASRRIRVGPQWVAPLALRGTESFVSYATARYRDYPMRIQGPGAGADVTAAGVLADVLSLPSPNLPARRR